jgi:protease-4
LLDTFHETLVDGIAKGRNISREHAAQLVDEAPYFGREAVEKGLADELAYEDEVPAKLGIEKKERQTVDAGTYLARVKRPLLRPLVRPPVIAVVPMHGAITHAAGPLGGLSTDERITRMVRMVRRDRRVKGVILHIDSPGGSALASDLMHHEIEQLARDKPVIACMANVAASGGYYVAAPAACIVARPTTVTGSIGVVAARLDVEPLLSRLGIRTEAIERGKHASLLSPSGPLDPEARSTIERELAATYRAFVGVVAAGRKMPEDDVERLARGRVYTGQDALEAKLVDVLGGFDAALEEVKRRVDVRLRDRLEVRMARTPRHHQDVPDLPEKKEEAARKAAGALLSALLPARERIVVELAASGERVLALGPVTET